MPTQSPDIARESAQNPIPCPQFTSVAPSPRFTTTLEKVLPGPQVQPCACRQTQKSQKDSETGQTKGSCRNHLARQKYANLMASHAVRKLQRKSFTSCSAVALLDGNNRDKMRMRNIDRRPFIVRKIDQNKQRPRCPTFTGLQTLGKDNTDNTTDAAVEEPCRQH